MLDAAPAADVARIGFPAAAPLDAQPDDPVVVELDGGEGAVAVLTGTVRALGHGPDGPSSSMRRRRRPLGDVPAGDHLRADDARPA